MKTRVSLILVFVLLLASIGAISTVAQDYNESPMLAAMVEAGDLPPVAERLPVNPRVVEPLVEVGTYGGALRQGFTGSNVGWGGMWYTVGWDNLAQWSADFSGVVPNIAESWDISDDVTEYTFHLREGMKWSDGAPFTADDIIFYIEDVLYNTDLSPGGPTADWLPAEDREGFVAEKIDDYTVKFVFPNPYGTFPYVLAQFNGRHITWFPKHYLMQFHADYNTENLDELVAAEEGVEDWVTLFNKKASGPTEDINNYFNELDRPLLFPWVPTSVLGGSPQMTMERNPYYWKVDTEGNQLPYIDEVIGITYQDNEARTLAMMNGDLDYVKDPGGENRILYYDALESGAPIAIYPVLSDAGTTNTVQFNRTCEDSVLAEMFADINFRIGMSYAINREEVIEIVHLGQGTPAQAAPLESSPLYNEQLATQYIEYDVDLANQYLDMVIPDRGGDGYRLRPDGESMNIIITVLNDQAWTSNWVSVAELLIGYWDAVGVEVTLNAVSSDQHAEYIQNNVMQAILFTGEGGAGLNAILDPRYYVPGEYHGMWGTGWWAWRVQSQEAIQVEWPPEIKAVRDLYEEVLRQPSQEAQIAKMLEVLQIAADNFWVIGISRPGPAYQPHHVRLGNQPELRIDGWIEGVTKLTYPEQWYIIQ